MVGLGLDPYREEDRSEEAEQQRALHPPRDAASEAAQLREGLNLARTWLGLGLGLELEGGGLG